MMPILQSILAFFKAEKTTYSHRNRTIEIAALEKGIAIHSLKAEIKAILEIDGRIEAIEHLTRRFHLPLSAAWRFVDKLDSR